MNKIWLIFMYEYTRHVLRKRFLITLFSVPLFMVLMMGVSIAASVLSVNRDPVGFIDHSGALADLSTAEPVQGLMEFDVRFIRYESEESARADLDAEKIQAYYVIAPDYLQTANASLYYLKAPANDVTDQFESEIRALLLRDQPADVHDRLQSGSQLTLVSADGSRSVGGNDWINIVILVGAGILFIVVLFTSSGYLMQALVEEKENRTMEIIATSVSPEQLMAGKVLGNLSVGITQMAIWMGLIAVGLLAGRGVIPFLDAVNLGPDAILVFTAVMIPGFVMVAALMALLGASFSEAREAQQWTSLVTLPVVAPYWIASAIIVNPNSPLAVGLSLFPLTAPVTLSLRLAVTVIPIWQVALSSAILIVCAVGSIWLAARVFRLGMVRYGKKVALKEIFARSEKSHA